MVAPGQPMRGLARYEDLVFSPLALPEPPQVDVAKLIAWMSWAREEGHKRGLNRSERGYEARTGRQYPWLMANVHYVERSHVENSFDGQFPEVVEYARGFPVNELGGLALLAQRASAEAHLHTDSDGYWGFRFYLANKNPGSLYFCMARKRVAELPRALEDWSPLLDVERRHYAPWRDGREAYCLNSIRAAHAVEANACELGERIACLVFARGRRDERKLLSLLDESTARFRASQLWYPA